VPFGNSSGRVAQAASPVTTNKIETCFIAVPRSR
jgi:hypothetical protein